MSASAKSAPGCPACSYLGPPTRHGLCPKCGRRLASAAAPSKSVRVPRPARELSPALVNMIGLAVFGFIPASCLILFYTAFSSSGAVSLGDFPLGLFLIVLAVLFSLPSALGGSGGTVEKLEATRLRVRHFLLHGRNAVLVKAALDPGQLERGARIELSVALLSDREDYLKASYEHYRDPQGRFRASQISEAYNTVEHEVVVTQVVFPVHALELLATGGSLEAQVEVTLFDGEKVLEQRRVPLSIPLSTEDFPALEVSTEGVEVIAAHTDQAAVCMVCGDVLGAATVRCGSCDVPHHQDCWEYNGGCSTYSCEGVRREPVRSAKPLD